MENLKVGDWVKYGAYIFKFRPWIKEDVEYAGHQYNDGDEIKSEYYTLWVPEPGEWCWFYDKETDVPTFAKLVSIDKLFEREVTYLVDTPSCISKLSYGYSKTMSFRHCESFIGNLPSNVKD